jgi:hypothetical protein
MLQPELIIVTVMQEAARYRGRSRFPIGSSSSQRRRQLGRPTDRYFHWSMGRPPNQIGQVRIRPARFCRDNATKSFCATYNSETVGVKLHFTDKLFNLLYNN